MNIWIVLYLFLPYCHTSHDKKYECGEHGRFEYCIDGIPGCIIGCHCHPGFYFDTDTKICEPNTKLTELYNRRRLGAEPTRIQIPVSRTETAENPSITTTNPVDDKVDEIAKDADDLGDWLYNQFFKTVESQVINNNTENKDVTFRRSGAPIKKMPKRRSHKISRKRGRKKNTRKSSLKKKIARITSDDSLFDSDDDSSDDTGSDSSTDSDDYDKSSKEHGHKKILIFNKSPKTLPSFIFLPNMDTPYYPPIGLPPPPVVPMYPQVPVAPVPPAPPFLACDDSEENTTSTTTTSTTAITTTTVTTPAPIVTTTPTPIMTTTSAPTITTTESTPVTTVTTSTETIAPSPNASISTAAPNGSKPNIRSKNKRARRLRAKLARGPRAKFLQQLRAKMKGRRKIRPGNDMLPNQDFNIPASEDYEMYPDSDDQQPMEDIDFKYLSQLIHRVDLNKSNTQPGFRNNHMQPISVPGRRNYNDMYYPYVENVPNRINQHKSYRRPYGPDNDFYTNLGRQIASMIRTIDSQSERQVNIEIEKTDSQNPSHPVFSENTYAPRSYWERAVRSPLHKYFSPRRNLYEYMRNSNENLFRLENKVETAASTPRLLSLQELESAINNVQENFKFHNDNRKYLQQMNPNDMKNNFEDKENPNLNSQNDISFGINNGKDSYPRNNLDRLNASFNNNMRATESGTNKFISLYDKPTRKPNYPKIIPAFRNANQLPTHKVKNSALSVTTYGPNYLVYQSKPILLNHKTLYFNNDDGYNFAYPVKLPADNKNLIQQISSPQRSYFHHELHHFDYFD